MCPANLDGFEYLDQVVDPKESAVWSRELRPLLEKSSGQGALKYWPKLWAAEFRAVAESEYDTVRARVETDVARLEMVSSRGRTLLGVLLDGYRLARRNEDVTRLEALLNGDRECQIAEEAAGRRLRLHENLTPEQRQAANREYAKLTREWVQKWPESNRAWAIRLSWVTSEPDFDEEEFEQVGERRLALDKVAEFGWTSVPVEMRVAQAWTRGGIRFEDSVRMAQTALDQLLLGPEEDSDLVYPPAKVAEIGKVRQFGFDASVWDGIATIVDAADQLKDFDGAHSMLQRMRQWLKDNEFKKDDSTSGYPRFEGRYLESAAKSAEAEGNRLDALALYTKTLACCGLPDAGARPRTPALGRTGRNARGMDSGDSASAGSQTGGTGAPPWRRHGIRRMGKAGQGIASSGPSRFGGRRMEDDGIARPSHLHQRVCHLVRALPRRVAQCAEAL